MGVLLAIMATASIAAAASSGSAVDLPMPQELAPRAVTVVLYPLRGLKTISKQDFQHALVQAAVQVGLRRIPKRGQNGYYKIKRLSLTNLVEERWIEGQAVEMGIGFTPSEIATELGQIKKRNFKSASEYERFLHQSHYTMRDVHEVVKVQMLKTAIQQRVLRGVVGKKAKHETLSRFVSKYARRWRSRTVCASGYVTRRCSNFRAGIHMGEVHALEFAPGHREAALQLHAGIANSSNG